MSVSALRRHRRPPSITLSPAATLKILNTYYILPAVPVEDNERNFRRYLFLTHFSSTLKSLLK